MTWLIESVRLAVVAAEDVFRLYADPSTWSEWVTTLRGRARMAPLSNAGSSMFGPATVVLAVTFFRIYRQRVIADEGRPVRFAAQPARMGSMLSAH